MTSTIDRVLADSRRSLHRLTALEAANRVETQGALLVDIRPELNRRIEGVIPGALVVDRNVLEWRLDPTSDARLPLASYDLFPIIVCNEGYASSLAAASLQQLGLHRATDLIDGYRAWRNAGLPVAAYDDDRELASP